MHSTVLLTLGENRYRDHITTRTARYSGAVHVRVHLYCIEASSITRDQNYSVPLVTRVTRVDSIDELLHAAEAISAKCMYRYRKSLLKLPETQSHKSERRAVL